MRYLLVFQALRFFLERFDGLTVVSQLDSRPGAGRQGPACLRSLRRDLAGPVFGPRLRVGDGSAEGGKLAEFFRLRNLAAGRRQP